MNDHVIAGTEEGLRALLEAVQAALAAGQGTADLFVNDGEGYRLHVVRAEGDWQAEAVQGLAVPYTDEDARERRKNAVWPAQLVQGGER